MEPKAEVILSSSLLYSFKSSSLSSSGRRFFLSILFILETWALFEKKSLVRNLKLKASSERRVLEAKAKTVITSLKVKF